MPGRKPLEKHAQAAGVKALHAEVERMLVKAGAGVVKPPETDAVTRGPARSDRTYTREGVVADTPGSAMRPLSARAQRSQG